MAMVDELWRECAIWLTRCRILPPDHKANWPDTEIKVLALTLRDGVLLCNLAAFLDPSSLDTRDFHRKPQMAQFLCCQNIKLFLETCKTHFGIREADLFEPTMLYDLTNFHRVLITLSKLSQCRKVQQLHPNIPGFSGHITTERSQSDEAMYRDLHSTNIQICKVGKQHSPTNQLSSLSVDDDNSGILDNSITDESEEEKCLQANSNEETKDI